MTRDEAEKVLTQSEHWEDLGPEVREKMIDWLLGPGQAAHATGGDVFEFAFFDEMIFLDEGWAECGFCERKITTRVAPGADDDLGWHKVADEHSKKCQATRAGTVVVVKAAKVKKPRKVKLVAVPMPVEPAAAPAPAPAQAEIQF